MEESAPLVAGDDYFGLGADQYSNPQKLGPGKYASGENIVCRGGIAQTRPGSRTLLTLPRGRLQGMTLFKPINGVPSIVAAVDGLIYQSPYPFTYYSQIANIQFSASSQFVAWSQCLKSTEYTGEGELYFLDSPYSVLVMQDGATRAAYWDGESSGHLNPTPSPLVDENDNPVTAPGYDETPVGLWMKWANNRLWVSRGNQIFASDIGNPLKFTEFQYLNEGRAFYLSGNCTGIEATTDQQGIICFTESNGTFLQSSIQDRTQWLSTPGFQKDVLPSIGCVAPRSIVSQYGMLWWYSPKGLINQDDALRANITSRLSIQDNPMYGTKRNICYDLSPICSAPFENLILVSVPWGDRLNRRTMVLDQTPTGEQSINVNAWASYWTGWRPVEWAYGVVNGEDRLFMASVDYDGANRLWEVGMADRMDNGIPITCSIVTREHMFGHRDNKDFSYLDAEIVNIKGDVSMLIAAAGVRGGWEIIGRSEIISTVGQIYGDQVYGEGANLMAGSSAQSRVSISENYHTASECNSACVESDKFRGLSDRAFSAMFIWSGVCGINAYRIFTRPSVVVFNGECQEPETGIRLLNDEGCGSNEAFSTTSPFTTFMSSKTFSQVDPITGFNRSATVDASSIISQRDADRRAYMAARAAVTAQL